MLNCSLRLLRDILSSLIGSSVWLVKYCSNDLDLLFYCITRGYLPFLWFTTCHVVIGYLSYIFLRIFYVGLYNLFIKNFIKC